jgi:hypothetical protein
MHRRPRSSALGGSSRLPFPVSAQAVSLRRIMASPTPEASGSAAPSACPPARMPSRQRAYFAASLHVSVGSVGSLVGSSLERYNDNRRAACESALEGCPVAEALNYLAAHGRLAQPCEAAAEGLLWTLAGYTPPATAKTAQWPKTPRSLSCLLRRIAPQLRETGIDVVFGYLRNGKAGFRAHHRAGYGQVVKTAEPTKPREIALREHWPGIPISTGRTAGTEGRRGMTKSRDFVAQVANCAKFAGHYGGLRRSQRSLGR